MFCVTQNLIKLPILNENTHETHVRKAQFKQKRRLINRRWIDNLFSTLTSYGNTNIIKSTSTTIAESNTMSDDRAEFASSKFVNAIGEKKDVQFDGEDLRSLLTSPDNSHWRVR